MANEPLGDIELIHGCDPPEKRRIPIIPILFIMLIIAALVYLAYLLLGGTGLCAPGYQRAGSDTGYYTFNETTYYKQGGSWYEYDPVMGWVMAAPSDELLDNSGDYYKGDLYSSDFGGKSFSDSDYYNPEQNYRNGGSGSNGQANDNHPAFENDNDEDNDW